MNANTFPMVSIIVPCYNVEQYLPKCIESILNQSYANWELILIDDGSPDSSGNICDSYADKDNRIRVIHKENGGLSSARNAGIDIAKGEYITCLDSDDYWHKDFLKVLLNYSKQYNAEIVQCGFRKVKDNCIDKNEHPGRVNLYDNHSVFIKQACKITIWAKLYKRNLFEEIRMPIGKINEDDYTTWKLYFKAKKICVLTGCFYYYRINPHSIMAKQKKEIRLDFIDAYNERISFFNKKSIRDLEDISRLQYCKALFLSILNTNINTSKRELLIKCFNENWNIIKKSEYIPIKFRIIFLAYSYCPDLIMYMRRFIKR